MKSDTVNPPTLPEEIDSSPEMVVFRDEKKFVDFFTAYFKENSEYNEIIEFLNDNQIPAIVLHNPDPKFSNDEFKPLHFIYHANPYFGEILGVKIISKRLAGKAFEDIVCSEDQKKVFLALGVKQKGNGNGGQFVQYHKAGEARGKKHIVRKDDARSQKIQYIDGRRKNEKIILNFSFRLYDQEETRVVTCSHIVINESGFKRIIVFYNRKT